MAVALTLSGVILFLSTGCLGAWAASIRRGAVFGGAFGLPPVGRFGVGYDRWLLAGLFGWLYGMSAGTDGANWFSRLSILGCVPGKGTEPGALFIGITAVPGKFEVPGKLGVPGKPEPGVFGFGWFKLGRLFVGWLLFGKLILGWLPFDWGLKFGFPMFKFIFGLFWLKPPFGPIPPMLALFWLINWAFWPICPWKLLLAAEPITVVIVAAPPEFRVVEVIVCPLLTVIWELPGPILNTTIWDTKLFLSSLASIKTG